jgi:hypothetical protein
VSRTNATIVNEGQALTLGIFEVETEPSITIG